jgi:hypothetical protein
MFRTSKGGPREQNLPLFESYLKILPGAPVKSIILSTSTFIVIDEEEAENTLMLFNDFHHKMKFTIEYEDCKKIRFLDVQIKRDDNGNIETSWSPKDSDFTRMLNFGSFHTMSQKLNVANNLIKRVVTLTSNKNKEESFATVKSTLRSNGYPIHVIKNCFNEYMQKSIPSQNEIVKHKSDNNDVKHLSLTHMPFITAKIQKALQKHKTNIRIAPKNTKILKQLHTNMKQKIEAIMQSQLIYRIICIVCKKSYTGMTFRQHLDDRNQQHLNCCKRIMRLAEKYNLNGHPNIKQELNETKIQNLNGNDAEGELISELRKFLKICETSRITSHFTETGHNFDFQNPKIIDKSNDLFKLEVLEMIHIRKEVGVNKMTETEKFHPAYHGLIDKF